MDEYTRRIVGTVSDERDYAIYRRIVAVFKVGFGDTVNRAFFGSAVVVYRGVLLYAVDEVHVVALFYGKAAVGYYAARGIVARKRACGIIIGTACGGYYA